MGALLGLAALFLAGTAGWLWLIYGLWRDGYRHSLGALALQTSSATFFLALALGARGAAFLALFFPPVVLIPSVSDRLLERAALFSDFLARVLPAPLAISGLAFLLSLIILRRKVWAPGIGLGILVVTSLVIGEARSRSLMCQTALASGYSEIRRNTLLWSLTNTPREYQFEVHALAGPPDDLWAWSYRDLSWYPVPATISADVHRQPISCHGNL